MVGTNRVTMGNLHDYTISNFSEQHDSNNDAHGHIRSSVGVVAIISLWGCRTGMVIK
jgi:hypothetical protein